MLQVRVSGDSRVFKIAIWNIGKSKRLLNHYLYPIFQTSICTVVDKRNEFESIGSCRGVVD